MKAMLLPLTGVEATPASGDESAPSEKGAGQGFDAVLALVSAQAASQASGPKAATPAAPAAPSQSESNAMPAAAQAAARAPQAVPTAPSGNRAAGAGFGPWLAASAIAAELAQPAPLQVAGEQLLTTPALPEAGSADEAGELERLPEREDDAQLAPSSEPRAALPAAVLAPQVFAAQAPVAPQAAAAPQAAVAPQGPVEVQAAPVPRAPLGRASLQQPAQEQAAQAEAAGLFQRELLGAQPVEALQSAPVQGDAAQQVTARPSARPAAQLAGHVAPVAKPAVAQAVEGQRMLSQAPAAVQTRAEPVPSAQLAPAPAVQSAATELASPVQHGTPAQADTARGPAELASGTATQLERIAAPAAAPGTPPQLERIAAPAAAPSKLEGSAATAAAAPAAARELENIVSGDPRVTVRMVEIAEPEQAPATLPEGEGIAQAALAAAHEERPEAEPAGDDQQLEAQAAHGAQRMQPVAPLPSADVQGARGLEAVVASLLRAGNRDASVKQPATRSSTQRIAQLPAVETTASVEAAAARVKLAEGAGSARDALAQQRDEREPAAREQLELALPHALMQPELEPAKETPAVQSAAPTPALPQLVDPDAVQAGKPGQTGASITIDHPELGAMDLLVQSQNGRIEVRAILETPHAAQVLRAHESALRYGIQQAGMTFGALRVRTRTGDGETVKARDNVKLRRRDHEWEA